MKSYVTYVCEQCGKESRNYAEIKTCEASHYGLTLEKMKEWEKLQKHVRYMASVISITKNEKTEKDFDDAIASLLSFEKEHVIDKQETEKT